ncbi:MAG TPA: ribosome biogenesis GTPase YlqF [Clostridiales bacterium]|nr:ribosome biogenesis GTPase YlqF [Clostridiales bacterium]
MIIQWFPGHMTKALRMMEKEIKIVDAIIYVLDARAPYSCVNPKLNSIIGDKPIIYVLNKCDMADPTITKEWQAYFSNIGHTCIMLNSTESGTAKKVETAIRNALSTKIERLKSKGINFIMRAMVLGVPNSGKSTLINNLCGVSKAITGDRPGVTKGKQWVKIASGIEILDTPGTLWPAFDNNVVAHHLAYIGSIKEEVLDIPSLSLDFIEEMCSIDPSILTTRYNITIETDDEPVMILENICKSRGYLLKRNELDYDRGAFALINDFKSNRLGKISLEKVSDIKKLKVKDRLNQDA